MSPSVLKDKITRKFGTLSNFSRLAGIDRYELQKKFARRVLDPNDLAMIEWKARTLTSKKGAGDIAPKKLRDLKRAVREYGGVLKFTTDNPTFSRDSVNQILAGRRKRISPVVKSLLEFFRIE